MKYKRVMTFLLQCESLARPIVKYGTFWATYRSPVLGDFFEDDTWHYKREPNVLPYNIAADLPSQGFDLVWDCTFLC